MRWVNGTIALLISMAPLANAQEFKGSGQQATALFELAAGLVIIEFEHHGTGRFEVRMLDAQGNAIQEVARGEGALRGSKAVRISDKGHYLFDIAATGEWQVRARAADRDNAPAALASSERMFLLQAEAMGDSLARRHESWSWPWFMKGMAGGVLTGPIGMFYVAGRANRSSMTVPVMPESAVSPGQYRDAFQVGFSSRVRATRKESAFVGGMVGTAAWAFLIVKLADVQFWGGGSDAPPVGGNPANLRQ